MNIRDELLGVVKALNAAKIPYALCGGLAVGVHGYPRATEDIDLLIVAEDLDTAKKVLRGCGFTLESGRIPLGIKAGKPRDLYRVSKVIDNELLMVDFMLISADLEEAWKRREALEWRGEALWIVTRKDLLRMKKDAGRPIDLLDVERLEGKDD